jgi:hypothetical protein
VVDTTPETTTAGHVVVCRLRRWRKCTCCNMQVGNARPGNLQWWRGCRCDGQATGGCARRHLKRRYPKLSSRQQMRRVRRCRDGRPPCGGHDLRRKRKNRVVGQEQAISSSVPIPSSLNPSPRSPDAHSSNRPHSRDEFAELEEFRPTTMSSLNTKRARTASMDATGGGGKRPRPDDGEFCTTVATLSGRAGSHLACPSGVK